MNNILLDTSGYRFLVRGHLQVLEALETVDNIVLNSVIVGEILCGFDRGGSREKNKKIFDNFMESKDVLVLPVDGETAIRYAYLFTYLQKAGTMVSPNDLWIAATAMQHGFRVMTLDRDFLKIPQILVDYFEQM